MLYLGSRIRLTRPEVERLQRITGFAPVNVRTLADLAEYVSRCKAHYRGVSQDTQFLHWLIDREIERCLRVA
jgi:predicted AAA+ superfamily ATPase